MNYTEARSGTAMEVAQSLDAIPRRWITTDDLVPALANAMERIHSLEESVKQLTYQVRTLDLVRHGHYSDGSVREEQM
jgi:hypothetical protein